MSADRARQVVDEQAEDEGLWFVARTAPEAYLQQELRRLHAAIEDNNSKMFVPREPTREMLAAIEPAIDACYNGIKTDPSYEFTGAAVWRAMYDAYFAEEKPDGS